MVGALPNKQVDACAELATNCAELNGLPQSLARTGVISFALLGLSVCLSDDGLNNPFHFLGVHQ